MLERFADEMDRVFGDFGLGRGSMAVRSSESFWAPDIDVFHRNNELVVRADLPGLSREDIKVDVTEDRVTIQGERRHDQEETREGVYRAERSYGSFYREVLLPPGAMSDQAKATFRDGVLEIVMPAPPESARRGRRLEIQEKAETTRPVVKK
jgi:HSP20 family protein